MRSAKFMNYDYEAYLSPSRELAKRLPGHRVVDIVVHFVDPEANVIYILTNSMNVSIHGAIGGEILRIALLETSIHELEHTGMDIRRHQPFNVFIGHRIVALREIGAPWNGHGWEVGFEGLPATTMLIQSIYADPKPAEFNDCLRLGVSQYEWNFPNKALAAANGPS